MRGPFTPWDVPLANDKESFFFAGHYFGLVAPQLYRLCFPLRAVRWAERMMCARSGSLPPLIFDGCASHLSAPWVPQLVSELQSNVRPGKPMLFIVCVREPVSQHLSWWRLEHGSMAFAEHLGLGDAYHGPPTRIGGYPPATLDDAMALGDSEAVRRRWSAAESLAGDVAQNPLYRLPDWALPLPNGQLSALPRFGHYAASIERWLSLFHRDAFVFVSLDELAASPDAVLDRIAAKCTTLFGAEPPRSRGRRAEPDTSSPPDAITEAPVLNASSDLPAGRVAPDAASLRRLGARYRPLNEALFRLIGEDLGWHQDKRYPWYRDSS